MKRLSKLNDRIHSRWTRRPLSVTPEATATAPAPLAQESHPDTSTAQPIAQTQTQADNHVQLRPSSAVGKPESVWSAAYSEALSLLDEETRLVVSKGQDLEKLFDNLNETNNKQKNESTVRRGLVKVQTPIKYIDSAAKLSSPLASFHPTASAAFSIVQSVTTLALGVCGMEDRLNSHITDMLRQIKVIDECDAIGQKLDDEQMIHEALVCVYKDLLLFYYAVVHVLTKKSVALAWISEQFNDRIPPVVQDFLKHATLLYQHIDNATTKIIKSIETLLIDSKVRQLLGSNKLDQLEIFHMGLTNKTADNTCRWVIDDPAFCTWYETATTNPLILYGEMGNGKTTTVAFLIDYAIQLNRGQIPSAFICYHYYRDDETGTSLYAYSSLIQQLMQKKTHFKVEFNRWVEKQRSENGHSPTQNSKLLGDFFFDSITSLERPVFIFLDGLDECDDRSCEELLTSFKQHSLTMPGLRCCVSARYNGRIQQLAKGFSEIHMPKDPGRDVLIVSHMVDKQLSFLKGEARDLVIDRLSGLAKGSAIWVQMAVDLLALRNSSAPGALRRFLKDELPQSKLSDLYAKLFSQITKDDDDNIEFLSAALEILATVERPLSISELGWAVALRGNKTLIETVGELEDFVDTNRMLGFLSPFVSSVDFEAHDRRQVQLVHQSIRDFVFQSSPRSWKELRLATPISDALILERRSQLHGKIAQECVQYLLLPEIGDKALFSDEEAWTQTMDGLPGADVFDNGPDDTASTTTTDTAAAGVIPLLPSGTEEIFFDPAERGFGGLFTYASCYWLQHLRRTEHRQGPALPDIITLTTPNTTRSENWWEQLYSPDCTFHYDKADLRSVSLHPLSIVSLYGSTDLFEDLIHEMNNPTGGTLVITTEQREDAVEAILQQGDMSRLTKLIHFDPNENLEEAIHLSVAVMRHWSKKCKNLTKTVESKFNAIFDHIASSFDVMVEQSWGNEMLCLSAGHGCLPIVERLFKAASVSQSIKQEILRTPHRDEGKVPEAVFHQSVGDAAWNGHGAVVAFLLEQEGIEPHLRYRDLKGNNVLHKAIRCSEPDTLKMLLSRYPEGMSERDTGNATPLQALIFRRRSNGAELVKAFLEAGADVRCGSDQLPSSWHEPIRMASRYGDVGVIKVLVRVGGADPMSVFIQESSQYEQWSFIDPFEDVHMMQNVKETLLSLREQMTHQVGAGASVASQALR